MNKTIIPFSPSCDRKLSINNTYRDCRTTSHTSSRQYSQSHPKLITAILVSMRYATVMQDNSCQAWPLELVRALKA